MRVAIFGAAGKTGGLLVDRALTKGYEVTVLVRNASSFKKEGVRVVVGDATKLDDVLHAVRGQDAVIDAIGGSTPYKTTSLESTSVRNMIEAMKAERVGRLLVISMMGIGESRAQAPFWYKHLLMPTFLRGSTKDKTMMEEEVVGSGLKFVIARPPILKDDPPTGGVTVIGPETTGHAVTRADLASFMVDQLEADDYLGRAVTVVNQ
jgi:nucleoside-diphosphate-sugar epimerase